MTKLQNPSDSGPSFHKTVHVVALLTACMVFPLIIVGAGVTSKEAGMAYADWPTSAGHLVNPPEWWQNDDTRWEHGHRLIGWIVGMLATLLVVLSFKGGGLPRRMAIATFVAIGIQGVAGGMRVIEVSTFLAMLHGIWGQICFCLAATTALITSRAWCEGAASATSNGAGFLRRLCVVATVCVFVQLVLGAAQRHFASDMTLLVHVLFAMVVSGATGWVAMSVMGAATGPRLLVLLGNIVAMLMAIQLLLGGSAYIVTFAGKSMSSFVQWAVPSAHVAVGALLLAAMFLLTLCVYHMLRPQEDSVDAEVAAVSTT